MSRFFSSSNKRNWKCCNKSKSDKELLCRFVSVCVYVETAWRKFYFCLVCFIYLMCFVWICASKILLLLLSLFAVAYMLTFVLFQSVSHLCAWFRSFKKQTFDQLTWLIRHIISLTLGERQRATETERNSREKSIWRIVNTLHKR